MYKKIGIVNAVEQESAPFLAVLENDRVTHRAVWDIHEGKIAGAEVAVLCAGIGRASSSAATQMLIDTAGVDAVIFAGTAGAMASELRIEDIVIVTQTCCHDIADGTLKGFFPYIQNRFFEPDPTLLGYARAAEKNADGHKFFYGRAVSGEVFVVDDGRDEINKKFAPMCVDMETAGVAQICFLNDIPFLAVRGISDSDDERGMATFEQNLERTANGVCEATRAILAETAKSD